jgi:hypothetical protein
MIILLICDKIAQLFVKASIALIDLNKLSGLLRLWLAPETLDYRVCLLDEHLLHVDLNQLFAASAKSMELVKQV